MYKYATGSTIHIINSKLDFHLRSELPRQYHYAIRVISLLGLGLTSSVLALNQDPARGKNGNNPPSASCNTVPGSKRRAKARDASFPDGIQFHRRAPAEVSEQMDELVRRSGTYTIDQSCNGAPPTGSSWGPRFPTMKSVIDQAWADAMTLATRAATIPQNSPA
jgi:hypothetical protein